MENEVLSHEEHVRKNTDLKEENINLRVKNGEHFEIDDHRYFLTATAGYFVLTQRIFDQPVSKPLRSTANQKCMKNGEHL